MWRTKKAIKCVEAKHILKIFQETLLLTWLKKIELNVLLRNYTHSEIRFFYIESYLDKDIKDIFFIVLEQKKKNWKSNLLYDNLIKTW